MHWLGAEVNECDFDQDFLSGSYLLIFGPYCAKNVSFNSYMPACWSSITFFFETHCILKG